MSYINYYFDTFKEYEPHEFYSTEKLCNSYYEVENKLSLEYSKRIGEFRGPYDSTAGQDVNKKPLQHLVANNGFVDSTFAKADITAMDLNGFGKRWDKWIHLTLPKEFILNYQKTTFDNQVPELVDIFKEFASKVIENNLNEKETDLLSKQYDKKYYRDYPYPSHRPMRPGWRFDLEVSMLWSVVNKGIIFPIVYNNDTEILERGTHRSLLFALAGNDVPIFVQNNIEEEYTGVTRLVTYPSFSPDQYTLIFNNYNKTLEVFNSSNEKISSYNTCS